MRKSHIRRSSLLVASALTLMVALTGCDMLSVAVDGDAKRDTDTGQVTQNEDIDIFALKVGDCMPPSSGGETVSSAAVVPCDTPHGEEVIFEFLLPEGDYPTSDVLDAETESQCIAAFEDFVGIGWEDSELGMYPLTPTEETWTEYDDRIVQCIISDPAGDITGTLKGAAR